MKPDLDPPDPRMAKELFDAALALRDREQRAYLDAACGDSPALRRRVEALLQAHEAAAAKFLPEQPTALPSHGQRPGRIVGDCAILEEIGRGGMGVVYRAHQTSLNRLVALKTILAGPLATPTLVRRFRTEAEAAARLHHPHIVPIFEVGEQDGEHYFIMKLIEGKTLAQQLRENATDTGPSKARATARTNRLSDAAVLVGKVAGAVHYAHQRGVLHRDLKPTNILLDGEGQPYVTDFGLAKIVEADDSPSLSSTTFGTPSYMPPEQAAGGCKTLTTAADVYSLGAIFYELLTGHPPFRGGTPLETLRQVCEAEPVRPTLLNPAVDRDLETICLKCLNKNPQDRYDSALALAEELERWRSGEPIHARAASAPERMWRWVKRRPALAGLSFLAIFFLLAGTTLSTWQASRATQAQRVAEGYADESRDRLVRIDVANGVRAVENGDNFAALLWFTEALRQDKPGTRAEAMHRYRIGSFLNYSPRVSQMWFHEGPVTQARFSQNGKWALTASFDHTARLWDVLTGQAGAVLRHDTNVSEAVFSANALRVLTLSDDGQVQVWDPDSGAQLSPPLRAGYRITHALISNDGRKVFTAGNSTHTNSPRGLAAKLEGEVLIWNAETGQQLRPPLRAKMSIAGLMLSPDGQWLAANFESSVFVWNLHDARALNIPIGGETRAVVIEGSKSSSVPINTDSLLPEIPEIRRSKLESESRGVTAIAFSPECRRLVTAFNDGQAKIWPLGGGPPLELQKARAGRLGAQGQNVTACHFSPDGQRVLLINSEGILRIWDARSGELVGQAKGKAASRAWFSPDGRYVFLDGLGQVWDLETEQPVTPNLPLASSWLHAAFSPDGTKLLTAGHDGTVRLWISQRDFRRYPLFLTKVQSPKPSARPATKNRRTSGSNSRSNSRNLSGCTCFRSQFLRRIPIQSSAKMAGVSARSREVVQPGCGTPRQASRSLPLSPWIGR